jgi:hypothetical protein
MFAGMDCGHGNILKKGEWFYCKGLIEVFSLNILFDKLVIDRFSINIGSTEEHSGRKVVLVIDDVHIVETDVLLGALFFLMSLENDDLVTVGCLYDLLLALHTGTDSLLAESLLVYQVLFLFVKVLGLEVGV